MISENNERNLFSDVRKIYNGQRYVSSRRGPLSVARMWEKLDWKNSWLIVIFVVKATTKANAS